MVEDVALLLLEFDVLLVVRVDLLDETPQVAGLNQTMCYGVDELLVAGLTLIVLLLELLDQRLHFGDAEFGVAG